MNDLISKMQQRRFGKTDMRVSVLGLGTACIGFCPVDDSTVDGILGAAGEVGINVLDSAAMYGDAEEKLGRLLAGRRDKFLLFTKCGAHLPKLTGLKRGFRKVRRSVGNMLGQPPLEYHPNTLRGNIEQSLRRLRTDRIDLIQLHSCAENILKRGEIIETLMRAKDAGKVRYIGYSGDGSAALWAVTSGWFNSIQVSVNVADQQALDSIIPQAHVAGLGIIAKRPVANAVWRSTTLPQEQRLQVYWDRIRSLAYEFIAAPDSVATALRFTLQMGVHTAIVGTTSVEHMRSNIEPIRDIDVTDLHSEAIRDRWRQVSRPEWVGQT